jgi:hypothetical protein
VTRPIGAALAALLLLAACSSGSSKPSSAPSTTAPTGDTSAYVDAVYAGLVADTPTAPKNDMRCVARAIVDGIGVARFHDAGVTLSELHSPAFEPPSMIASSMSTAERVALATRLQSCGIGRIVGSQVSLQFARTKSPDAEIDPAAVGCFGRGFEGAGARRMIAGMILNDLSIPDSYRLARLTVGCIGLAPVVASRSGLRLAPAESRCIDRIGKAGTTFVQSLADEFRNVQPTSGGAAARLGVQVAACLTPAHRAAVARRT